MIWVCILMRVQDMKYIGRSMRVLSQRKISLSAQEIPDDLEDLLNLGIRFNACSLKQLEVYGQLKPNSSVGVRFNPGSGSGGNNRTNVGGVSSSFGIWHEFVPEVQSIAERYQFVLSVFILILVQEVIHKYGLRWHS